MNVVLEALLGEGLCETDKPEFGSGVVGLPEAAEQTRGRGCVDDPSKLLLSKVRPGGF